jgi:UDP-N-acetylglucosamine--N-acetylmuramyl-(pentapeptide) pyrophosphoryl-undecaprenol N-acetylglucosamine transferase
VWVRDTLIPLVGDEARLADMAERARGAGSLDGTERLLALVRTALAG